MSIPNHVKWKNYSSLHKNEVLKNLKVVHLPNQDLKQCHNSIHCVEMRLRQMFR